MKQAFTPNVAPSVSATCRTWSLRLLLLTVIACFFAKAQAQYTLTLYGKDLQHKTYSTTTNNATCSSLKSGTIKFNATTGEVTLINVVFENTLSGVDGNFMSLSYNSSSGGDANIYLKGTNKITSGGQKPIRLNNVDVTFRRVLESGCNETNCILDITCTSSAAFGISLNNSSAFTSNCTVKVHGGAYGFYGEHVNSYEKLLTTHSIIYAKGKTASIGRLSDLQLGTGNYIRRPSGAAFNSSLHGVALNGSLVTDEVLICDNSYVEPGDTEKPTVGSLSSNGITSSSVTLKWTQATDNETTQANLKYWLRYKKDTESTWSTAMAYTTNVTTYTVYNLDHDTKYNFLLTVKDEAGNEANYTQQSFTTKSIDYKLRVGGVDVTSRNASNITSDMITSGTASYDPDTRTLKLDNVKMEGAGHTLITFSGHPGLNIQLEGSNSITNTSIGCIALWGNSRIYGSGSLTLQAPESGSSDGILIYKESTLTIDNTTVEARGGIGIGGMTCLNSKLVIKNSNVKAYGTKASIRYIESLTLEDCYISDPTEGYYYSILEGVVDSHGSLVYNKYVVIEPAKVKIAGMSLLPGQSATNLNWGQASLSSDGNTLTLNDVTIDANNGVVALELDGVDDFTIEIIGDNTIKSTAATGLDAMKSTDAQRGKVTFKGPGALEIRAQESSAGIMVNGVDISVDNTVLILDAKQGIYSGPMALVALIGAIFGNEPDFGNGVLETLTVNHSRLYYVYSEGQFLFMDALYLNHSVIDDPEDVYYSKGLMWLDGEQYAGMVFIEPQEAATSIDGIAEMQSDAPWTTLGGQRIDKPTKAGIYLHGGKKVVVK